jgi:hypothetical protein
MRLFYTLSFGLIYVCRAVAGQESFEPDDFDVIRALVEHGVNISSIPNLSELVARSPSKGCALAVKTAEVLSSPH